MTGVFKPNYTTENTKAALLRYLPKGGSVLDVGTGTGALAIFAKENGAGRVLAIDCQKEAVECASANAEGLGIEVEEGYLNFGICERFDITVANLDANEAMEFMQYAGVTMAENGLLLLTWASIYFGDECIYERFDVVEQTEGNDYNLYVLKKR